MCTIVRSAWIPSILALFLSLASIDRAQTSEAQSGANWQRVVSDSGEFSIEVPSSFSFFADKDGFVMAKSGGGDVPVKGMQVLNSVSDGTVVSVEIYEVGKAILDQMFEQDKLSYKGASSERTKDKGYELSQNDGKPEKAVWTRKYFASKKYIYILTAGSRQPNSEVARRFFASMRFSPNTNDEADAGATFSNLRVTTVEVEDVIDPELPEPNKSSAADPDVQPLMIISRPMAGYTQAARDKSTSGVIRLKATLTKEGGISKIVVVRSLPNGLLRQAVFALLRIKFLPKTKAGQPFDSTVTIDYTFAIF